LLGFPDVYTAEANAERRELRALIRDVRPLIEAGD